MLGVDLGGRHPLQGARPDGRTRMGGPLGWIVDGHPELPGRDQVEGADGREGDDLARDHDRAVRVGRRGRAAHVRAGGQPAAGRQGRQAGRVSSHAPISSAPSRAETARSRRRSRTRCSERDAAGSTAGMVDGRRAATEPSRLDGRLHTRSDVELLERLVARVPGVVAVDVERRLEGGRHRRARARRALEQPRR